MIQTPRKREEKNTWNPQERWIHSGWKRAASTTLVSVNLHCKAMQEAGSWQGDRARNGTETSGLLGGGHRLVKGGGVRFLGNRREESKGGGNGSWLAMP